MIFQRLKSSAVVLMAVIILAKILGMLRDVVLAYYFGTSNVSDAYLIASSVPTLLFYFIGHALSTSFLPMYNKVKESKGEREANNYANNLLFVSLLISTVIVGFLVLAPQLVVKIFAVGFDAETTELSARFIRLSAISLYIMTVISIWTGFLQSKNNFIIPAIISVPRNIAIMLSVVLAATVNIVFLGIGLVVAYVLELLLLFPFVLKDGYKIRFSLDLKSPDLKETLYIVMPIIIGVSISQVNKIIDKSIASTVVEGGVSALSYASVINNAIQEVLVTGIITILFAKCAAWVAQDKHTLVKEKLSTTIQTLISILVPASCGVVVLSREIVRCLLGRGSFDESSVSMTVGALCCYTIGLTFLAIRDTLIKVFYAYKYTKVATIVSVASIVISIVLKIFLGKPLGINGLAISTSLSAIVHCLALYIILYKRIGSFELSKQAVVTAKTIVSSFVMVLVLIVLNNAIRGMGDFVKLILMTLIGGLVYFVMALVLQIPLAKQIIKKVISITVRKKEKDNVAF